MGILDLFRRSASQQPNGSAPSVMAYGDWSAFYDFNDPRLVEFMRAGGQTQSGATVTVEAAMRNPAVFRCVSLISYAMGMLPLHLRRVADKEKATEHPLFRILHRRPNDWQTAIDFRSHMQLRALLHGDGYALIIRQAGEVRRLLPLDPLRMEVIQNEDWSLTYRYRGMSGDPRDFRPSDVLHLRGLSMDGLHGMSMVKQAAEAIGLAMQAELAAARLFKNGMMVGGALMHPSRLSEEAYNRLKSDMQERYGGADKAHHWMIAEEGMKPEPFAATARDSQMTELRGIQIEEIGRVFGVPRPFLGVDDTSWGTGIDVLGQFFVRYALNPWFEAWQQAIERSLLTEQEAEQYEAKFNPGALLRGSMKDQAEFFAKGLGSGGHQPFLEVDEVRGWLDLPHSDDLPPMPGTKERDDDAA